MKAWSRPQHHLARPRAGEAGTAHRTAIPKFQRFDFLGVGVSIAPFPPGRFGHIQSPLRHAQSPIDALDFIKLRPNINQARPPESGFRAERGLSLGARKPSRKGSADSLRAAESMKRRQRPCADPAKSISCNSSQKSHRGVSPRLTSGRRRVWSSPQRKDARHESDRRQSAPNIADYQLLLTNYE